MYVSNPSRGTFVFFTIGINIEPQLVKGHSMKNLRISCRTASTVQGGTVVEKSRTLAEITIYVEDDFELTEKVEKELSKTASELVSGIATKERDVYQCHCTLDE